ncbi:MAG: protein arginine kinase [Verrucomicrobia bacterium]|nr:protein arginine kinase [Verrucomicrobiota bacterium]
MKKKEATPLQLPLSDPKNQIVISSRVRFARNLKDRPFPGVAKKAVLISVMEEIKAAILSLPEMEVAVAKKLEELTLLEKQILVERHLMSCEHALKAAGSALVLNQAENLSVMINEEDHLRMQAILPGLQLQRVLSMMHRVDDQLEEKLNFAFHPTLGYLTACPTNVGTGMRASVMLHLPGLVISEQINKIINSVSKMGLAVRGLYGEGSDAKGNLFQISNQITLGEKEETILQRLSEVIEQILQHEQNARTVFLQQQSDILLDQVGRAYGILSHAYSITTKEALNLLSLLKLGVDLHLFPEHVREIIDQLFMESQPAHLQRGAEQSKMSAKERDTLRATLIRTRVEAMPDPVLLRKS